MRSKRAATRTMEDTRLISTASSSQVEVSDVGEQVVADKQDQPHSEAPANEQYQPHPEAPTDEQDQSHPEALADESSDFLQVNGADDLETQSNEKQVVFLTSQKKLKGTANIIWIYLLYAGLLIASWTITCILQFRPLPKGSYTNVYNSNKDDFLNALGKTPDSSLVWWAGDLQNIYETSRRWYQAARTMQAVVALFTLTFISIICSRCVVVYLQISKYAPTLRQALTLADRGWLDFGLYLDLFRIKRLQSRSSTPLFIFMALTAIGAIIAPLQLAVVGHKTIKVPSHPLSPSLFNTVDIYGLLDKPLPSPYDHYFDDIDVSDDNFDTGLLRASLLPTLVGQALSSARLAQSMPNLWIDEKTEMDCQPPYAQNGPQLLPQRSKGCGQTYGSKPLSNPPFLTQTLAFKNTGLIKQFIPRMNSSLAYYRVDGLPEDCKVEGPGFYIEHASYTPVNTAPLDGFERPNVELTIRICSLSIEPPWKPTRDRQDIQETFYLQLGTAAWEALPDVATFKIQANTTLGWFELPNYSNNNRPGPLLDLDPFPCPDDACAPQTWDSLTHTDSYYRKRSVVPINPSPNQSHIVESASVSQMSSQRNVGPLALTIMALFGQESWLAQSTSMAQKGFKWPLTGRCAGAAPLALLNPENTDDMLLCINHYSGRQGFDAQLPLAWVDQFFDPKNMQASLTAAVILASDIWLSAPTMDDPDNGLTLHVYSDPGRSILAPNMSWAAMVGVSALIGVYLTFLLALVVYSRSTVVWTKSMDALALVKLGTAVHEAVSLMPSEDHVDVKALDELPGWFGDAAASEKTGRVALGASGPLISHRAYEMYPSSRKTWGQSWHSIWRRRAPPK